jgi:U3 small nucleolar ribonucleoprotein component
MEEQLGMQEEISRLERKKRTLRERILDIEDEIVWLKRWKSACNRKRHPHRYSRFGGE